MSQNLQAVMLQITEVDQPPAGLLLAVTLTEGDNSLRQLMHQRSRLMQLCQKSFCRTPEQ
ncbi:hypothetical protein D3C71_1769000 [compost metagenome]